MYVEFVRYRGALRNKEMVPSPGAINQFLCHSSKLTEIINASGTRSPFS